MSSSVVWAGVNVSTAPPTGDWDDFFTYYYAPADSRGVSASDNIITISDGSSVCNFAGGYSDRSDVFNNKMTISGSGLFEGEIYGGYATVGDVEVYDNHITIIKDAENGDTSTFKESIYGGYSYDYDATGNTVTIEGGNFGAPIYGGYSYSGNAGGIDDGDGNTVTISGGKFSDDIIGGYSEYGAASLNEIVISKVDEGSTFGTIFGGNASGNANKNKVTLKAENAVYGGEKSIVGGYSNSGTATENMVDITNGTFNGNIYGGMGYGGASENTVNIEDGTFNGDIYGGYAYVAATGNTVNISGTADLRSAYLYGGASESTGTVSGNTLNIGTAGNDAGTGWAPTNGRTISSIKGFDVINIYGVEWDETNPYMTTTDVELKDTKINAYVSGEQSDVNSKKMTLIDATNLTKASGDTNYLHGESNSL